MLNLAVFVSGRGSNFVSVYNAIDKNHFDASVKVVVSNKIDCPAVKFALKNQIKVFFVSEKVKDDFITFNQLIDQLKLLKINLIVLAGFIKKIPAEFVEQFENKIINIHPALLPSFGGEGMYGMNVHKAVFEKSCKVSGATVHFVNNKYDDGKIIFQKSVDISDVSSPEEIAKKVLRIEHQILPFVIKKFAENKIKEINNRIVIG
jgi:formyltetrahydrofolate-dependent phosphoribosylglycinamide formyltransferase